MRTLVISATLALGLAASGASEAATYKGRSLDERRYTGNVFNEHAGKIQNVQIRFNGEMAFVGSAGQLVLELRDPHVTNPREIEAYDHKRGIVWILEVLDIESGRP